MMQLIRLQCAGGMLEFGFRLYTDLQKYICLTLYIYIYIYTQIWLRKFRIAPDIPNVNTACQRVSEYSRDVKLRASLHRGNWTLKKQQFHRSVAVFRPDKVARIASAKWGDTLTARTFLVSLNRSKWLQSFSVMHLMSVKSRTCHSCSIDRQYGGKNTRKEALFKRDNRWRRTYYTQSEQLINRLN